MVSTRADTGMQNKLADGYESLILSYAAGTLDEAQHLIVATHLALSAKGRRLVCACEAIGGAVLENDCTGEAMRQDSLKSVLARLDTQEAKKETQEKPEVKFPADMALPDPLAAAISLHRQKLHWKKAFPGMHTLELKLDCQRSTVRFLKVDPAVRTPRHSHGGMEITLVLDGAFTDETGSYKRGDLIVTDERFEHTPVACPQQGCVCLVVSTSPIRLRGWMKILNPFLKA